MLLVMWASLALMLLNQLAVVLVGLLIFTFAFLQHILFVAAG